jgi:filamentous hemagglutinin family protein
VFKALFSWFRLSLCTLGYLGAANNPALAEARLALGEETSPSFLAQVTSDGTVNTQVTENGNTAEITEGETRGNNLFHSFQDFSVKTGNEAFFNNADSISNIFSRVTGGNVSDIDGAIRANGSANLFLINPAGIVFGEGASLNIGGSFYGSSASSILFKDGEFSAVDSDNPPLLTVNAPIGLGFRDQPGDIINRSTADAGSDPAGVSGYFGLRVPDGKSFALAGGEIKANGGGIVTFGGRIDLAAVEGKGTLGLTSNGNDFSFSFPGNLPRGDVSLTNQAGFLVAAGGGGDIVINARNIDIEDNSYLNAGILSNSGFLDGQAGTAKDTNVQAGDIVINARNLNVNNSAISNSVFGKGNGGNLIIDASESIVVNGGGLISTDTFGEGDAGNLTINVENFTVQNSQISASTLGEGNAGNLTINATESIELSGEFLDENRTPIGPGGLLAQSDLNATGKGGNLAVETKRLSISNGSKIQAATFNNGDAGEIEIRAPEIDLFNTPDATNQFPTEISAGSIRDVQGRNANSPLKGNGGSTTIETEQLIISNGARINIRSDGQGNSGSLNLQTNNLTLRDRAQISVANAFGEGGNINLKINNTLTMRNNTLISAQAFREADGGNLEIDANFIVAYPSDGTGNDLVATSDAGNGGNINLTVEKLFGLETGKAIDDEANPIANNSNDIDASSNVLGLDGTVNINTSRIDPLQGAMELPSNVVEAKQTTEQTCSADRDGKANNGLAIAGRGGISPAPDAPLNSEHISNENPPQASIPEPIETSQGKIQPARGIMVTESGKIILTAYRTNNAGERIPEIKPNCN